jgi:hypothetical protein
MYEKRSESEVGSGEEGAIWRQEKTSSMEEQEQEQRLQKPLELKGLSGR